jgi:hypothetical protein
MYARKEKRMLRTAEAFDELLERTLELDRQELVASVAVAERQFSTGDCLTLKEAVQAAETRWQAQEQQGK